MKISTLRALFHTQLSSLYEKREIEVIFFTYIEYKYGILKYQYFLNPDDKIEFKNADMEALANGTPIQYVTGKTTFCNFKLTANPSVLIPRQETEELVQFVVSDNLKSDNRISDNRISDNRISDNRISDNRISDNRISDNRISGNRISGNRKSKILDLCTGSGAIAIALAKNIENAEVWATDISEDALETAQKNAADCDVKITFLLHDILNNEPTFLPNNVDIIVSNPPYIPLREQADLHRNVVNHEPNSALFVPNENPLIFYDAIAKVAKKILRKGGILYFETHEKFHFELSAMLADLDFKEIKLWNDINGKPRFASCKKL